MDPLAALGSGRSWPELRPNPAGEQYPLIRRRRIVHRTPYQRIYHVIAEFQDFTKEYFVDEGRRRAGLVVDLEGEILLVRQYRLLIDRVSWEVPGGAVDRGESPEQSAVRECLEETGVRCFNPQPLLFMHMGLDTLYSPTHLFFSTEVAEEEEPERLHPHEGIAREWVPLEHCIEKILAGKIVDSFSIAALLTYWITSRRIGPRDGGC